MKKLLMVASGMLLAASFSYGQSSNTATATLSVAVGQEAAIAVNSTSPFVSGGIFQPYTATTSLTYWIRTSSGGSGGTISLQVTSDFSGSGGPSVTNPVTAGDALTYLNTVSAPGTPVSGPLTASTGASTGVATFPSDVQSTKSGNSASTAWTLTNDPAYKAGSYSATVTYTISAT